ncbi:CidA/LrgA family protein, partial [Alistipes sp. OttesenSCG-928-L06]|nr:CidA/LrgA family protein [Alistipes sp. OttesenSCG-928-L06]
MIGLFYLLLFYFLGECVARLTGNFIPGSVIGMILLFAALYFKVVKKEDVRGAAMLLLDNLLLFFIPVCVGLMTAWPLISEHWLAIVVSCVLSTLLIIAVVGRLQQWM